MSGVEPVIIDGIQWLTCNFVDGYVARWSADDGDTFYMVYVVKSESAKGWNVYVLRGDRFHQEPCEAFVRAPSAEAAKKEAPHLVAQIHRQFVATAKGTEQ